MFGVFGGIDMVFYLFLKYEYYFLFLFRGYECWIGLIEDFFGFIFKLVFNIVGDLGYMEVFIINDYDVCRVFD